MWAAMASIYTHSAVGKNLFSTQKELKTYRSSINIFIAIVFLLVTECLLFSTITRQSSGCSMRVMEQTLLQKFKKLVIVSL